MKKKYPILKTLKSSAQTWQKIVIACAILHNIGGIHWAQENIHPRCTCSMNSAHVSPSERVPIIKDAAPSDKVHKSGQILQ
jgi:hypothetical protein